MLRIGRARTVLGIAGVVIALTATQAVASDPGQVLVPDTGYAILGDRDPGSLAFTAFGPATAYRSPLLGQNNTVNVVADDPPWSGRFYLLIDDLAPANRRLFLDIRTPSPISYTCVKGPEDPNRASNRHHPRLGAQVHIAGGKAQLLCFDSTGTRGYMVYTTTACVKIVGVEPATPPFATHYVVDGRGCQANVYVLNKNQLTPITYGGKTGYAKVFDFPIYFEADA